jgi:hypothetical protein
MRRFVAVLLILCAAAPLQAKDLRPFSLRELTYRADVVVLAVPVDSASTGQFKVTHVFRGNVKENSTIVLPPEERKSYSLAAFAPIVPENPGDPPSPVEALLYLSISAEKRLQLVPSGLLLAMSDGAVLLPRQLDNPGGYVMAPQEDRMWANVVRDAKTAAAAINEVFQLKAVIGKERTPRLLQWIERHRLEFGGGFYDGDRTGWGSLETDVFDWICDQARPEECWAAVRLYAELNHGATLRLKGPTFDSTAGRNFLFEIAMNVRMLDGDRARALTLLANSQTLTSCSDEDLAGQVQKLPMLLGEKTDVLRSSVIAALRSIQSSRGTAAAVQLELKNALPTLETAYKAEKPGAGRDQLVEIIHTIGGAEHWKEFSGSKTGAAVLLRDFDKSNDQVYFWLQMLPATDKSYERPTLVLERLDAKDKVLETKTLPLPVANAPKWEDGWTPGDLLLVQFPSSAMTAPPQRGGPPRGPGGRNQGGPTNTWRISVRGTVGKEKVAWTSEPKLFVARPAPFPDDAYPYPIEDK